MSELVLKSMYVPEDIVVAFRPHFELGICIQVQNGGKRVGLTISCADACQLRDFLNKELGEQASEPMGTGQAVYLETDSRGNNTWEQFPTIERAKSFADKRISFGLKYQAVGLLHQQLVPVVTTSYEWKEIG